MQVDVAVVGGGGAGLSLLLALDRVGLHGRSIALIDPVRRRAGDRTWCYWDTGASALAPIVFRSWRYVDVVSPRGAVRSLDLAPFRYLMVRSADLYAAADVAADRLGVCRVEQPASEVEDGPDRAIVTAGRERIEARWVFDSRPAAPTRTARTTLVQHFRGWTLRSTTQVFAADRASLMDFRTPQPARGLSFGYVLPHDASTALVEYTEFSPRRLPGEAYDAALSAYVRRLVGASAFEVVEVEDGAIPMSDAGYARRVGRRVFRLGTAGGATRGSTGYTFAAIQRSVGAVAAALRDGADPVPPRPYPLRHAWLDAALLRALDRGLIDGPEFFVRLFASQPPDRVLRFLDGRSTPAEELAVMRASPLPAMTRASFGAAWSHLRPGGR